MLINVKLIKNKIVQLRIVPKMPEVVLRRTLTYFSKVHAVKKL